MWKYNLLSSLVILKVILISADNQCCDPGHQITFEALDGNLDECVDAATNVTSLVNLPCKAVHAFISIEYNFTVNSNGDLEYYLLEADTIQIDTLPAGSFCIGETEEIEEISVPVALVCGEIEPTIGNDVLAWFMVVSGAFLLLTGFMYLILPEVRDLQGKSIICFCISMSVGFFIMAGNILVPYSDMKLCAIRGFCIYFFFMAAFFWTNVLSIQILRSFLYSAPVTGYGWKEFLYYCLYAWGVPFLMTVVTAAVNFAPGNHKRPGIGLNHCWFFDAIEKWKYMYSVMTLLIVANIGIFAYTSVVLWKHNFSSSHVKQSKYKFWLTCKLFTCMGIPWVFEIISSLTPPNLFWEIMDCLTVFQVILIFVFLVVLRKRVIKAMYNRGYFCCIRGTVEQYLAIADEEEEDNIHTAVVQMNEKNENVDLYK